MYHPKRSLTVLTLALCVLLSTVASLALAKPQAASSDTTSDTTQKPKKRHTKTLQEPDSAATSATATPASASPSLGTETNSPTPSSPDVALKKIKTAAGNSDPEIAAARASGKVWVNLESGIYHKNGRWYGKTKNGKFMTESEAKASGYKQSQRN